jgi:hypothetical protein
MLELQAMARSAYTIWNWGDAVGQGAMASRRVGVAAVAKCATTEHPYAVMNEVLCGHLARGLCLPVPPGVLIQNSDDAVFHASLNFAGESPPPADAKELTAQLPELAWGIVLFDFWIANPDRHAGNLTYYEETKKCFLFDHSHAFFNGQAGVMALKNQEEGFIGGHCIAPHISSYRGFESWTTRIKNLPDYWIKEGLDQAIEVGLPPEEITYVQDFLETRRQKLRKLIFGRKDLFPLITEDDWKQIKEDSHEHDS